MYFIVFVKQLKEPTTHIVFVKQLKEVSININNLIFIISMTTTISSFTQLNLDKPRTLVLCDIDDTILHFPERDTFCKEIVDDFYPNAYMITHIMLN